nr:PREDICTED: double-stranded RNA-binding protein 2-like isoform X1 [Musa acuminata subsp. malaccensis]XP_018682138.1 PREDICTED: double-stranded RNA-binding protein 2-like isoform X1 [Musa acuminata subsp. malaccensis]XP_018682139.1 PREDICTED: double-stranded RNA-binding protein 2-like isoform X1 [Musa acuminata subsp. malaccensis]
MYKNQLQELAQRSCFNLPSYASIREGPDHAPRFKATVNFNGEAFESPTFCSTLRQAEHSAAEVALNTLSKRGPSRSLAAKVLDETGIYKNLLQETAHRAGLKLPVYTTVRSGPGHTPIFTCTVELAGMSFTGDPAKTKKQAQKNAAMAAWSALKHFKSYLVDGANAAPRLGSSSSPSAPSLSESEKNEEQEPVILAHALAKLQRSEENWSSSQNGRRRGQQRSPPQKSMHPTSNVCFCPIPFQNLVYPDLSSESEFYQMWHQVHASPQQSHFSLTPHARDHRSFPILHYFYPSQVLHTPSVEQDPVSSLRCSTGSSPSLLVCFSDHPVSVASGSWSQFTIQQIHGEQNQRVGKEWLILPSSAEAYSALDVSGSSLRSDNIGDASTVQKSHEDQEKECSLGGAEAHLEEEANSSCHGFKSVASASCPTMVQDPAGRTKMQERKTAERSQGKSYGWMPRASVWPGPSPPNHSLLYDLNSDSSPTQFSHGSPNSSSLDRKFRPFAVSASMRHISSALLHPSGLRDEAFRRQVPSPAAPVTIRTTIPVCSARAGAVNPDTLVSSTSFVAPPVNVRSVVPVCSAPPVSET